MGTVIEPYMRSSQVEDGTGERADSNFMFNLFRTVRVRRRSYTSGGFGRFHPIPGGCLRKYWLCSHLRFRRISKKDELAFYVFVESHNFEMLQYWWFREGKLLKFSRKEENIIKEKGEDEKK